MEHDVKFIENLIGGISKRLKNNSVKQDIIKTLMGKSSEPLHANYNFAVNMYERIKVHAELSEDSYPEKIFRSRAPRMTDDENKYLKDNYKQVTLPVFLDMSNTVNRIFHDANYNLTYQQEDKIGNEKTLQEYLETGIPELGSLENYVKDVVKHNKLTDANGYVAVKPREIPVSINEDGEVVRDDRILNEPIPYYYSCSQVMAEETDEYVLFLTTQKSPVEYGGKKDQNMGYVFEFYDTENIYLIRQIGKFIDFKFEIILYYNHGWEKLPCVKMKGVPMIMNGKVVWASPFMYAVDLLDLVALNSSYLTVIIAGCVYPYRVMYGDECEFEHIDQAGMKNACMDGYVNDSALDTKLICPGCHGTGLKSRISPFGVMLIKTPNLVTQGDAPLNQTPMEFVSPSMSTPEFLMKKIASDEMRARNILHLNTSSSNVQGGDSQVNPGAETATGQVMDLKALYAFIKPISDQIFYIWEFLIDAIGFQRYGEKYKKPLLTYPNTFDFYTESDYMNNIATAVKTGMPTFVVRTILYNYLKSLFYNEKQTANVFDLIYNSDRIITMSSQDASLALSKGLVERWELILHESALTFVTELIEENENFFEQDFEAQKVALIEKAKAKADEIKPESQASGNAQDNIEAILRATG